MIILCPHCGAQPFRLPAGVLGTNEVRCHDCGLAVDRPAGTRAPGGDEVRYELQEMAAADRVLLLQCVVGEDIGWRWERGPVLVVPEAAQAVVESILAAMSSEGGLDDFDGGGPTSTDDDAQALMADLFVAADRLFHAPGAVDVVEDIDRLRIALTRTATPFGVDLAVWNRIGAASAAVVLADESGDEEDIEAAARDLRTLLRDYI